MSAKKNVAVLGASKKEERYSYKAVVLLKGKGYNVFPVHPAYDEVAGIKAYKSLSDISDKIDTLSLYISKDKLADFSDEIIFLNPKRVIMNPGTESDEVAEKLEANNIIISKACTLVLLKTGQF